MLRDVSGLSEPYLSNITGQWATYNCKLDGSCKYGLMNYFQVIFQCKSLAIQFGFLKLKWL